jgi:uncharacterized Zn-binding protein involved in type VI secretion
MSLIVAVNGLSLVHKGSNGLTMATVPDVCKTPGPAGPVPVPYPNISRSATLAKGTKTVTAQGEMAAVKGSEFPSSSGDEAGTVGGVKSGTHMKAAQWLSYSFDVKLEGKNACRLTDKMTCNNGNTVCLAGIIQGVVGAKLSDPTIKVLCDIFCKTKKDAQDFKQKNPGKRFDYSRHARDLARKPPYSTQLARIGSFMPEKSFLVAVKKGALGGTARKAYSEAALRGRLLKEAAKKAGAKLLKGKAKSAVLKFVPGLNAIMLAWDVVDVAITGYEVYQSVNDFMKNYDTYRIRPDMAELGPDGEVKKVYDYKFDYPEGGSDNMSQEQEKLYRQKTGQRPIEINQQLCKCK